MRARQEGRQGGSRSLPYPAQRGEAVHLQAGSGGGVGWNTAVATFATPCASRRCAASRGAQAACCIGRGTPPHPAHPSRHAGAAGSGRGGAGPGSGKGLRHRGQQGGNNLAERGQSGTPTLTGGAGAGPPRNHCLIAPPEKVLLPGALRGTERGACRASTRQHLGSIHFRHICAARRAGPVPRGRCTAAAPNEAHAPCCTWGVPFISLEGVMICLLQEYDAHTHCSRALLHNQMPAAAAAQPLRRRCLWSQGTVMPPPDRPR